MSREKLALTDSLQELVYKMSEGNPGALNVIFEILNSGPDGFFTLLGLDDMNIRGTQIWLGYKDCCHQDMKLFLNLVKNRDNNFIEAINIYAARQGTKDKAVASMGSYKPEFFTDEEMKEFSKKTPPVIKSEENQDE